MSRRKKELQPYWRPNFVNQSELPDIKVVRTGFIVNFIAVTLALVIIFYLLQREYRSYSLGQTIAKMEQQIHVADADDVESLKLSEAFRSSAQYVMEVEKFFDTPFTVHDFLYSLSSIKPDSVIFNSVSLNEQISQVGGKGVVTYNASISGDAKSLTGLNKFKGVLEKAEFLQIDDFVLEIDEILQGRDEKTGIFSYRLAIVLTPKEAAQTENTEGGDGS